MARHFSIPETNPPAKKSPAHRALCKEERPRGRGILFVTVEKLPGVYLRPFARRGRKRPTSIMNICHTSRKLMAMTATVGMRQSRKDSSGKR